MEPSPQSSNGGPLRRTVKITNPQGFHLRPMQFFAKLAAQFSCQIRVEREGRAAVDGKSVLSLMSMSADRGMELIVEAQGQDASAALEALVNLLANLETQVDVE